MFWKCGPISVSAIDTLLANESFTLEQILDEDIVVQECRSQNRKLLDYLTKPETLEKLVDYVLTPPDESVPIENQFLYANVCADLLSSGVHAISDSLIAETELMNRLWGFFLAEQRPLHELLASFVCNIINSLFDKSPQEMLVFLRAKEHPLETILDNFETAAVSEMVLRLIQRRDHGDGLDIMSWLREEDLLMKIVGVLEKSRPKEAHDNVGLCIGEILNIHDEINLACYVPDPFVQDIQAVKVVERIMELVVIDDNMSGLVNGLTVVNGVFKTFHVSNQAISNNSHSRNDAPGMLEENKKRTHETMKSVIPYLPKLVEFLQAEVNEELINGRHPSIGQHRMKVLELFHHLLSQYDSEIFKTIRSIRFFDSCFDLFQKFHWNNFLHKLTEKLVGAVIRAPSDEGQYLFNSLINDSNLLQWLIKCAELNDADVAKGGHRRAYMGHLLRMAETLNAYLSSPSTHPAASQLIICDEWEDFITNTVEKSMQQNNQPLGNRPISESLSDDMVNLEHDAAEIALSRYLNQKLADDLPDSFGLDCDENDKDEDLVKYQKDSDFDDPAAFTPDTSELSSLSDVSDSFATPPIETDPFTSKNDDDWAAAFAQPTGGDWASFSDDWESVASNTGDSDEAWEPFKEGNEKVVF